MLQYLIILLDDTSASYCHYESHKERRKLIPLEILRQGIRFGMMENLMIQYVYPDYVLPEEYAEVIESIDHSKIKPTKDGADVWVTRSIKDIGADVPVVWRTDKQSLFNSEADIIKVIENIPRLNVVLTDVETFTDEDLKKYKQLISALAKHAEKLYVRGKTPQLNLITDRVMLQKMNNCGAGDTTVTLAPNGKFYVCPAFYYQDEADSIGDVEHGLDISPCSLHRHPCLMNNQHNCTGALSVGKQGFKSALTKDYAIRYHQMSLHPFQGDWARYLWNTMQQKQWCKRLLPHPS